MMVYAATYIIMSIHPLILIKPSTKSHTYITYLISTGFTFTSMTPEYEWMDPAHPYTHPLIQVLCRNTRHSMGKQAGFSLLINTPGLVFSYK